jgi:hypothetical protein
MPDCLQVFVRFEGFVPSGRLVMPDMDRAFSLLTMLSLLPGSWPGLFAKDVVFFHR